MARVGISYWWVERLGQSGRTLAPALVIDPAVAYKAARRGVAHAAVWHHSAWRVDRK